MRTEPANCGGGSVITATTSRQDVEAAFAIAQLSEREPLRTACGLRTTSNLDRSPPRFSHIRTAVMPLTSSRVERAGVKRKLDWQADRLSKQSRLHEVEVDEVQRAIETERNSFINSRRHQHLPSSTAEDSELVGRFVRTCGPGSREDGAMEQQLYVKVSDKTTIRRPLVVLMVQWLNVGLVIERSLVRLPVRALSSQLGQLHLPSLRGR